jgi:hypothetical protein
MEKPRVEIKKVKTFRGMEGYGLNADIHINGVKCMFVIDEGNGGEFRYETNRDPKKQHIIDENIRILEDYIKSLPAKKMKMGDSEFEIDMDMDIYIDDVLMEQETMKRLNKLQKNSIVFGRKENDAWNVLKYNVRLTEVPHAMLQKKVDEIKSQHCKDGVTILNTNLAILGIKV